MGERDHGEDGQEQDAHAQRAGGHGARREHHVEVRVGGATTVSVQHRPSDVEDGKVDVRFERAVGLRRRLADHLCRRC